MIIPDTGNEAELKRCLNSLSEKTAYGNYEVIVAGNINAEETHDARKADNVRFVRSSDVHSIPGLYNLGAVNAKGRALLFLHPDTEMISPACLEELLGFSMREDVGAVGARLYASDGSLRHAGMVLGMNGIAGYAFAGAAKEDPGLFGRVIVAQNYCAVSAACIMIRKEVFEKAGGFSTDFSWALSGIDLCLRLRDAEYRTVYNPYAEFYHHESQAEETEENLALTGTAAEEAERFRVKWEKYLSTADPYFNPNLSQEHSYFTRRELK